MWTTFLREAKGEPSFDQTYPQGVEKVFDRVWTVDKSAKKPVDCREKFFFAVCFLSIGGGSGSGSLRKKSGKFARKSLVFFDFRAILDKKLCT